MESTERMRIDSFEDARLLTIPNTNEFNGDPFCVDEKMNVSIQQNYSVNQTTLDVNSPETNNIHVVESLNISNKPTDLSLTTPEKKYECECGYVTDYLSNFNRHQLTHSDNREFECEECNKTYKAQASLARHIRENHQKKSNITIHFPICNGISDKMQSTKEYEKLIIAYLAYAKIEPNDNLKLDG